MRDWISKAITNASAYFGFSEDSDYSTKQAREPGSIDVGMSIFVQFAIVDGLGVVKIITSTSNWAPFWWPLLTQFFR